jgi:hypothetical protein
VLPVDIAPLDPETPAGVARERPLLPGFHPIASSEARQVGVAAGGIAAQPFERLYSAALGTYRGLLERGEH